MVSNLQLNNRVVGMADVLEESDSVNKRVLDSAANSLVKHLILKTRTTSTNWY